MRSAMSPFLAEICGGLLEKTKIGDVILAMTASTDSNINRRFTNNLDFAPHADFQLLLAAYDEYDFTPFDQQGSGEAVRLDEVEVPR